MTGCDANSAFCGHGKKSLYDKMMKTPEARTFLTKCGENLLLNETVMDDLKSYVIRYIYGDLKNASLDQARANKWKMQKKKSFMHVPPDDDSVTQHIKRANYLAYIQRYPDIRMHHSPIGHGWQMMNGRCHPSKAHATTPAHWLSCTANTTG